MAALPLIVFDVNATLLDLGTMEPTFERIFGDVRSRSKLSKWVVIMRQFRPGRRCRGDHDDNHLVAVEVTVQQRQQRFAMSTAHDCGWPLNSTEQVESLES
jgi:hypothetical protein